MALDDGIYKVQITTPIFNVQSTKVKNVLGNQGENLTGNLVVGSSINGNTVKYQEDFSIGKPKLSNQPGEDEIYIFIEREFDRITNYGADYIPEIHDQQVLRIASRKFGISESEADRIYLEKIMTQFK